MDRDPNVYDRDPLVGGHETPVVDRDDTGSSNFMAFLIGGLVIAIGLLAFLFYDGGSSTNRDVSTTGSTTRSAPATPGTATGGAITAPAPAPAGSGASTSAPTTGTAAPSRP